MNKEDLKIYLSGNYQGSESFLNEIIFPIFGEDEFESGSDKELLNDYPDKRHVAEQNGIKSITLVGQFLVGIEYLYILDIKVSNHIQMRRNRVGIQSLIRTMMDQYSHAFMLFHYEDENDSRWAWRFSYCHKTKGEYTNSKRFTFLLGPGQACTTAAENFMKLYENKDHIGYKDIEEAFSVEALSKEFFGKYKDFYENFVEHITGYRYEKKGSKWENTYKHEPDSQFDAFGRNQKLVRDYVKKMMGRIVFLYFLQRKGWLNGEHDYMGKLYKEATQEQKEDFLDEVLEPLFFGLLNTRPEEREGILINGISPYTIRGYENIPYLNGGLFEQEEIDKYDSKFPANMFEKLFEFFDSYNFTIDENDPDDAEIGVDPEMLGRIFENLLEDNKDKGAYYTPKEIVGYMCRESLIAYLHTEMPDAPEDSIRQLVEKHDWDGRLDVEKTEEALREVKICDPAIGSGAFPMGLLNELLRCRMTIPVERSYEDSKQPVEYNLKKQIIQNNIYGVDIEKGAIDIARLRFWLSLVVEADKPEPLPNFNYKFMKGNSLLSTFNGQYVNINSNPSTEVRGSVVAIRREKKLLRETQHHLFSSFGREKLVDEVKIKKSILSIIFYQLDYEFTSDMMPRHEEGNLFGGEFTTRRQTTTARKFTPERQQLLDKCKELITIIDDENIPLEKRAALDIDFFDWEIMFNDVFSRPTKEGFDIVIGNPPYIQLQNNGGELAQLYQPCGFNTFARTGDIYCLFYERGWQMLKPNGHLCYITSNKWMRAGYGEKTREFFTKYTNPMLLLDFSGTEIFKSATVDVNILLFGKANNSHKTTCALVNKQSADSVNNLSDFVNQCASKCDFHNSDSWVILSPIEQSIKRKIEAVGTPLKDWDIQINYGIKTGCNEAFIIDKAKREEILTNCQTEEEQKKTAELIRPILRGRDIKRYGYVDNGLFLINTHNGIKDKGIPRIDIEEYPAIKAHLDQYWDKISVRADKGDTPYNLRNCAYLDLFFQPKICWKAVGRNLTFSIVESGKFLTAPASFISAGVYDTYILAFLCSSIGKYYIYQNSDTTGAGDIMLNIQSLIKFPIPFPSQDELKRLQEMVEYKLQGNECDDMIDDMIIKIYELNIDEQNYIKEYTQ